MPRLFSLLLLFLSFYSNAAQSNLPIEPQKTIIVKTQCSFYLHSKKGIELNFLGFGFSWLDNSQIDSILDAQTLSIDGKTSYSFEPWGPTKERFILTLLKENLTGPEDILGFYTLRILRQNGDQIIVYINHYKDGTIQISYQDPNSPDVIVMKDNTASIEMNFEEKSGFLKKIISRLVVKIEASELE
ncbi:MAG: hypothetical protein AB7F43_11010 [Bacteriovoracia bacterium]